MKKASLIACLAVLIVGAYAGVSAYVISNQTIEQLLLCADSGGLKVPLSKALCRRHLFAERGTPEDIEVLHQGVGASFVVQGQSAEAEREQILKFLISKGLDVNRADRHQLRPLHGAVLANSATEVKMLLQNGANPLLEDGKFGLTPLALALKLQGEGRPEDRQAVIALLKNVR